MKLEEDHISNAIHFDNIDTSNKKQARMIAKLGATDVRAFMSPSGITFIEVTDTGNFIYTTVFPSYLGDKKINSEPQKDTFLFKKPISQSLLVTFMLQLSEQCHLNSTVTVGFWNKLAKRVTNGVSIEIIYNF